MSKKIIVAIIAIGAVLTLSIFSLSNALALGKLIVQGELPLTHPIRLCQEASTNYDRDIGAARARGLSLQLSPEEIDRLIQGINDYKTRICAEAARLPITSPAKLCQEAKQNYSRDIAAARAKGLSLQLDPVTIKRMLKEIQSYRTRICAEARAVAAALTSPAKLCKQAQQNYIRDIAAARAKGLSLQLSREEIDQMTKAIRDYRTKVCLEAAKAKIKKN